MVLRRHFIMARLSDNDCLRYVDLRLNAIVVPQLMTVFCIGNGDLPSVVLIRLNLSARDFLFPWLWFWFRLFTHGLVRDVSLNRHQIYLFLSLACALDRIPPLFLLGGWHTGPFAVSCRLVELSLIT